MADLARTVSAAVSEVSPGEYLVEGEADPARIAAITDWLAAHDLPLADLRAGRQRLEDVFLRLTAGAADDRADTDRGSDSGRRATRRGRRGRAP